MGHDMAGFPPAGSGTFIGKGLVVFLGLLFICANAFAKVKDVKIELALDKDCNLMVNYTNRTNAALKGTLSLNIEAGRENRKQIADRKINLGPGKTEVIDTQLKVSEEAWVFVQTSFSGAGTGTAIMAPADKTLKCPK